MLVSIVATDRNTVKTLANAVRDESWVNIRLSKKNGDFVDIMLSINPDVARELVAQLPGVIEEAERLAATGEQEAADA